MGFADFAAHYNAGVRIHEIRRRNLLALVGGGKISEFARNLGLNEKYVRLIKGGHSNCGNRFARDIEKALARVRGGAWDGWMDRDHGQDLEEDGIMLARRWAKMPEEKRLYIITQFLLAESMNFGVNPQINTHSKSYARLMEEFRQITGTMSGHPIKKGRA